MSDTSVQKSFVTTPAGILRICQEVSNLVVLITAAVPVCLDFQNGHWECVAYNSRNRREFAAGVRDYYMEAYGQGFVIFVAVIASMLSVALSALHFEPLNNLFPTPKAIIYEIISLAAALLVYFMAFCVECWYASGYDKRWLLRINDLGQWKACAVFVFVSMMLYAADFVLIAYSRYRNGNAQAQKYPGHTMPTVH